MSTTMPPVAQFSLPTASSQPQQNTAPSATNGNIPPVAQFSLPNSSGQNASQTSATTGSAGQAVGGNLVSNLERLPSDLYGAITTLFPGKQIGTAIGNSLQGAAAATTDLGNGNLGAVGQDFNNVNAENSKLVGKVAGDVIQAVALPATLAIGAGEGATTLGRIGNAALKFGAGGAAIGGGNAAAQGDSLPQVATQAGIGGLVGAAGGVGAQALGEGASLLSKSTDIQNIVDKLMPNIRATGPEVRAAMDEGRIVDGTKSTFWGSTPDTIAPRPKAIINAQTLENNIPGIADMSSQNMVRAIDDKTTTMAEGLGPVMKNTPITQADTGKIFDSYGQVKEEQQADPAFFRYQASNLKAQTQFEKILDGLKWDVSDPTTGQFKAPTPKSLDTIWQAQKDYDSVVPDNIKNLGPTADATDKLQNKIWLQNRTLLTSLRDDLASRLAPDVQKTFKDMSNMYDARRALVKNARINTKGIQGLITKGLLKGAGLIASGAGLGAGAGLLGDHLLNSQTTTP